MRTALCAALAGLACGVFAEENSAVESVEIADVGYRFTVDTTEAPDLTAWARTQLIPVLKEWYPRIVGMLPSEGFTAPKTFSIAFEKKYQGVAATAGNRIFCNPAWYRTQLKGEAIGSLVHELVHVAQQYRHGRPPGWLGEGIPDYIRWYLYEPQSKGCEISPKRAADAKHDGSYRVSANFLNFVVGNYDKDLVKELNKVLREGRYDPEVWKTRTTHTVEDLAVEWKKGLDPAAATPPPAPAVPTAAAQ